MVTPHEIRQRILKRFANLPRQHIGASYTTRDSPENTETALFYSRQLLPPQVTPHEIRQRILKPASQHSPLRLPQRLHHTRFAREY